MNLDLQMSQKAETADGTDTLVIVLGILAFVIARGLTSLSITQLVD